MKYLTLATLLLLTALSFAQTLTRNPDSLALLINGKKFYNGDTVRTEDLKALPDLQLVNIKTKQQYTPVSFNWVITLEGEIVKGLSTNKDNWQRLPSLLSRTDTKSLIFINNIKLDIPDVKVPQDGFNLIPR